MRFRLSTAPRFVTLLKTLRQEWAAQGIHTLNLSWLGYRSVPFDPDLFFLEDHGTVGQVSCCICRLHRERRFAIFIQLDGHLLGPIGSSCLFEKVLPVSVLPTQHLVGQLESIVQDMLNHQSVRKIDRRSLSTQTMPRFRQGWLLSEQEQGLIGRLMTAGRLQPETEGELARYLEFGIWNHEQLVAIHALYRRRIDRQHRPEEIKLPSTAPKPLYSRRFREQLVRFVPPAWIPLCGRIDATGKHGNTVSEQRAAKLLESARLQYQAGR